MTNLTGYGPDRTMTWLIVQVQSMPKLKLNYLTDQTSYGISWKKDKATTWPIVQVWSMTKISKHKDVTDHISPLYVENENELSLLI